MTKVWVAHPVPLSSLPLSMGLCIHLGMAGVTDAVALETQLFNIVNILNMKVTWPHCLSLIGGLAISIQTGHSSSLLCSLVAGGCCSTGELWVTDKDSSLIRFSTHSSDAGYYVPLFELSPEEG